MNFRFRRFLENIAVENLTLFLVAGQGIVYALMMAYPEFYHFLLFDRDRILEGQFWRLFSFVFLPGRMHPIFFLFYLYILYMMGNALEDFWGTLRYNVYIFLGVVLTMAVAFLVTSGGVTPFYLYTSLFLAFAFLNPDFEFYLFFILPVKVKWLAYLTWGFFAFQFFTSGLGGKLLIAASVANFFIFFGREILTEVRYGSRRMKAKADQFAKSNDEIEPMHRCLVCGKTDRTNPEMSFRYCRECSGEAGYCEEHIQNHSHQ